MRGYAVFLVFLVHHHTIFGSYLQPDSFLFHVSRFLHTIGNSGVDLFFVLSGYLIYGHLARSAPPYRSFIGRRIRRIYPTFLVVFGCYVLLSYLLPAYSKLPKGAVEQAVYLTANLLLLPGIFRIEPLITVAWSLSYEFLFYLSIPLILMLTGMRRWAPCWRLALLIALILAHCVGYQLHVAPHVRLTLFVAGMVAYELVASGWAQKTISVVVERGLLALYALMLISLGFLRFGESGTALHPVVPAVWSALLSFTLCTLVTCAVAFDGVVRRVFSGAALRWLGNISYSYFLVHGLALNGLAFLVRTIFPGAGPSAALFLALFAISLAVTLGAAMVLFVAVEEPWSLAPRPGATAEGVKGPGDALTPLAAKAGVTDAN
jgi:exopolysaccharide production protein ExoZ